ncbi:MAG: TetR/AcrR family transcriptional regulator [Clostridia bacterium]|nr:TetR/AcrR family transcriptional regulator [Clostridia bacterium]
MKNNNPVNEYRNSKNPNDKRTRKTKLNIRNALFTLLESKSVDQITVSEIVRTADINRSTFYFYYQDIKDLFEKTESDIFEDFTNNIVATDFKFAEKKEFVLYLSKYLNFCSDNYAMCRFLTSNRCNNNLADRIMSELKKAIPNSQMIYSKGDPRYYLTTFAISGFLFAILDWMDDGMKIPATEMAEFLADTYIKGSYYIKNKTTHKSGQ